MLRAHRSVHYWMIQLGTAANGDARHEYLLLSPDEQTRADRLLAPEKRVRFIICRAALREILGQYLRIHPSAVVFAENEHGKPKLSPGHDSRLEFNLSHTGSTGVLVVTEGVPVGVDIETTRPDLDFERMAGRYFRPEERAALMALPERERPMAFTVLWTRKEALLKGKGTGIAGGLDIAVPVSPGARAGDHYVLPPDRDGEIWSLIDLSDSGMVAVTLAYRGTNPDVEPHFYYGYPLFPQDVFSGLDRPRRSIRLLTRELGSSRSN